MWEEAGKGWPHKRGPDQGSPVKSHRAGTRGPGSQAAVWDPKRPGNKVDQMHQVALSSRDVPP